MNKYISVFPNTHSNISGSICIGSGAMEFETKEEAIIEAAASVPYYWPFLVFDDTSYDSLFHDAYEPDWTNPDGYGINKRMQQNFVAMGFEETFKTQY